jgi:AcrR family transcriptional regulator
VGFSTTIVTHYFSGKQELLLWAYRTIDEWARERFEEAIARDPTDLVGYLMSMTAVRAIDKANWRPYIAIWDRSLRDPEFASQLHSWTDVTLIRIAAFVRARYPECADATYVARRMLALCSGISVQLLFDPDSWQEEVVHETFVSEYTLLMEGLGLGYPAKG